MVLQDHSSVPGGADDKLYGDTLAALSTFFAGRLPSNNSEVGRPGKALLFSTWGHRDGSCKERPQHKAAYPNYMVMQDLTSRGYLEYKATIEAAVDDVDCRIVPVGEAFRLVYLAVERTGQDPQHPDSLFARLYTADGYHPSRLGSFLTACVFYGVISGNSPKFLEFDVRGRTLAIEGFLVGKAFIDSTFDDYMITKLGQEKWQPEPLAPELVRPLQAFAHAALYPEDAAEPIALPSKASRPNTRQSGGSSRPGTQNRPGTQDRSRPGSQQASLLGRPLGDASTPAASLQKAAAKTVVVQTLASAKDVMAALSTPASPSPHAESDNASTEAARRQAEGATTAETALASSSPASGPAGIAAAAAAAAAAESADEGRPSEEAAIKDPKAEHT